mmetsp:Transcript_18282/g.39409  ORF Transcript_18282/g.39409 Transcript_18282/m.39409 type:complete len:112 (-) Transcript_18282:1028-1363(-)
MCPPLPHSGVVSSLVHDASTPGATELPLEESSSFLVFLCFLRPILFMSNIWRAACLLFLIPPLMSDLTLLAQATSLVEDASGDFLRLFHDRFSVGFHNELEDRRPFVRMPP